jgi:RNA polymerase sigma-70 factor, ECF subfamily
MSTKPELDADFIARLQQQDRAAFCRLVQMFHRRLVGFAGSIAGMESAEDVVQEAWLAAWKALPSFEGRSALTTWLYTIVRNACIARLRKDKPYAGPVNTALTNDEEEMDAELANDGVDEWFEQSFQEDGHWQPRTEWHINTPEALLEESQLRDCLQHHIKKLQPMQKAVFELRDLDQIDLEEICNMLKLTSSNVRVLLHRARLRLHQVMDHYQLTGEC